MAAQVTTKTQVRRNWAYARELMRQAEVALKADDTDELADIALELSASASILTQYLADRGISI